MPVDIHSMRSEISIQPSTGGANTQGSTANTMDINQLREIIRDLVLEIIQDDLYTLYRMRGL